MMTDGRTDHGLAPPLSIPSRSEGPPLLRVRPCAAVRAGRGGPWRAWRRAALRGSEGEPRPEDLATGAVCGGGGPALRGSKGQPRLAWQTGRRG